MTLLSVRQRSTTVPVSMYVYHPSVSPTAQRDCASQYVCLSSKCQSDSAAGLRQPVCISSKYQSKLRSATVPVIRYMIQVSVRLRSTTVPVSVYTMQVPVQLRSTTVPACVSSEWRIHLFTTWHTTIHTTYRCTCNHYVAHNHTHHVYVYMYSLRGTQPYTPRIGV